MQWEIISGLVQWEIARFTPISKKVG